MYKGSGPLAEPKAYRAIFFEETQDHLADVENILLRLQPGATASSRDDLNAIFRAVHSIKGSASMLGCPDMAQLAHLQENLLDVLRKDERPLEANDITALLAAGDTIRAQALKHRGVTQESPDAAPAESKLRAQLARPRTDAKDGASGPVVRRFSVRVGPLAQPVDAGELDVMLQGLAAMGAVAQQEIANVPGGHIAFEAELEGTADDLQSVLALVVPPDLVTIEKVEREAARLSPAPAVVEGSDEFFVDPAEFRRKREAILNEDAAAQAESQRVDESQIVHRDTAFIRVATEKIDLLVNLVGELVINEAMLARCATLGDGAEARRLLESGLADLARHTRNLQESVLAIRMLPISNVFSRFPRLVHELSAQLGKRVELRLEGEATELDRGLIEKIVDPLTHLVRNAIDHGLESPDERIAAGKDPVGLLRLAATQRGGKVHIEVSDDGRGLDRAHILQHAARRGIAVPADAPDEDVWDVIFEPGFSAAHEVTELSGRGVGMDVVRRNIHALGGTIELLSDPGEGTTIAVSVPLTLAIIEAMIVSIAGATYVMPIASVVETLSVEAGAIHTLPGDGDTIRVRDDYLPVIHLAKVFPSPYGQEARGEIGIIVEADGREAVLVLDEVVGQQQVVVKSLEANFRKVPGISGATVMGDGSVALILDAAHIVRMPH
jgi:two-component system chemotaxis sensor kinase CheA